MSARGATGLCTIHELPGADGAPEFEIVGDVALNDHTREAVDRAWEKATVAAGPAGARLFDGPLVFVDMEKFRAGKWTCLFGRFRHAVSRELISPPVLALGVQGLVLAHDRAGDECVLLGRRGRTRMYPGLWENAPSGGVEPPGSTRGQIDGAYLLASLSKEGLEELAIDPTRGTVDWPCFLEDQVAGSIDAVARVRLSRAIEDMPVPCAAGGERAEYLDVAWAPVPGLRAWAAASSGALSPPTRALFAWLKWI